MQEILRILDTCKVCRVAVQDCEGLYIVPMNYGYVFENGRLSFYFHSAMEGRKVRAFASSADVAFEMDCAHQLLEGERACQYGYAYKSIIGNGKISCVADLEEKKQALSILMKVQTGSDFAFTDQMASTVAVFRMDVSRFTAKGRS